MPKPVDVYIPQWRQKLVKIPSWRKELRPKEAAAMLGFSTGLVYLLIREGKLRSRALVRDGCQRGIRLILRSDVEALLATPKAELAPVREPDAPVSAISGNDLPPISSAESGNIAIHSTSKKKSKPQTQ
jgi:hypothetical protein